MRTIKTYSNRAPFYNALIRDQITIWSEDYSVRVMQFRNGGPSATQGFQKASVRGPCVLLGVFRTRTF